MTTATEVFEGAMQWLHEHYSEYRFFTERDVVWTVQLKIGEVIREEGLHYAVFDNYTIPPAPPPGADLVILDTDEIIDVVCEFKYEPSRRRNDFRPGKLKQSRVFWSGNGSVGKDIERVREFVERGKADTGYSVFIDEGSRFRHNVPFEGSKWIDWDDGVSVLWGSFGV